MHALTHHPSVQQLRSTSSSGLRGSRLQAPPALALASPRQQQRQHRSGARSGARAVVARADKRTTGNAAIDNALSVGSSIVEGAANLVPESVPRGVAKGGVAVVGVLAAFWLLQKLVSTVLTVALLGGAAWFYFNYSGSGGDSSSKGSSGSSSGSSSKDPVDLNDPLAEARRIMDKYKK